MKLTNIDKSLTNPSMGQIYYDIEKGNRYIYDGVEFIELIDLFYKKWKHEKEFTRDKLEIKIIDYPKYDYYGTISINNNIIKCSKQSILDLYFQLNTYK